MSKHKKLIKRHDSSIKYPFKDDVILIRESLSTIHIPSDIGDTIQDDTHIWEQADNRLDIWCAVQFRGYP